MEINDIFSHDDVMKFPNHKIDEELLNRCFNVYPKCLEFDISDSYDTLLLKHISLLVDSGLLYAIDRLDNELRPYSLHRYCGQRLYLFVTQKGIEKITGYNPSK